MVTKILMCIGLLGTAAALQAQAVPTASRRGDLQVGVGFSTVNSDYSPERYNGIAAYSDFDFTNHFGVEAEFHYAKTSQIAAYYEKTYEIGGRYFRTYGRFKPYGKILVGRGVFNYQFGQANLAYNMFAGGVGADYRVKSFLNVRGDFEYQNWRGFPPNGLTPSLLTVGVAYHFK